MANRSPHLSQTTVSIRTASGRSARRERVSRSHSSSPAWLSTWTATALASATVVAEPSASLSLWSRLIHSERAPAPLLAVQSCHRFFSFIVVRHRNKAEAAGSPRIAIGRDGCALDAAMRFKQRPELGFCHAEREIADENFLHFDFLLLC